MSIPKEPRALMINLMYLVLTAMLALNVSAEIINAFFMIDKGIETTNKIVDESSKGVIESIKNTVDVKKQYAPLLPLAEGAKGVSSDLIGFIDEMRTKMTTGPDGKSLIYTEEEAKGNPKNIGKPKNYKDIDVTQRLFVEQKMGATLKEKIEGTREAFRTHLMKLTNIGIDEVVVKKEDIDKFIETLPLKVDDETWKTSGKPTWEAFTFGYMPVAAVYPLLRKFQNDAKVSESMVVNFISDKIGKKELPPDKFAVFSQAKKGYLLVGETYEALIGLGSYSSKAEFSVSVSGGSAVKQDNGMYKYTAQASSVGTKEYTANITVKNPLTGKSETFTEKFSYEVGQPSIAVSLDKMNVFYLGVDNPITVAAAGISSNDVGVSISGGGATLTKGAGSSYVVKVNQPDPNVTLTVTDKKTGKSYPYKYRAKKIPNPTVKLGGKVSGQMGSGEMKVQKGLFPELENFDFDAKCDVQSYELVYIAKGSPDLKLAQGQGNSFNGQCAGLLQQAKPGDAYTFMNMKVRCPGDQVAREVPGLSFTIK